MNGIENYPAAGEIFLENVILKVSQTHFPKDLYPKGGHKFFKGGQCPPLGGAVKYPGRSFKHHHQLCSYMKIFLLLSNMYVSCYVLILSYLYYYLTCMFLVMF